MEIHMGFAAMWTSFQNSIPLMEINRAGMQNLLSLSLSLSLHLLTHLYALL